MSQFDRLINDVMLYFYLMAVMVGIDRFFKDGACYCYCAYVLRISIYTGFLWVVPANTGIFLRGLKLFGESRT